MSQPDLFTHAPRFDGETFDPALDQQRLGKQLHRVLSVLVTGQWMTLREIGRAAQCPEASASARLRDLRKPKHGAFAVERRRRGEPVKGIWEYRLSGR